MLRKSLFSLLISTSLLVCAEAASNQFGEQEGTPPLRNLFQYSPNLYIEVHGTWLADRTILDLFSSEGEESSQGSTQEQVSGETRKSTRSSKVDQGGPWWKFGMGNNSSPKSDKSAKAEDADKANKAKQRAERKKKEKREKKKKKELADQERKKK